MRYKESTLGRWYLEMPTLYVRTHRNDTLWRNLQQINFRVNTNGQPARLYYQDGTLRKEWWHDPNGSIKRSIRYNPDGSVFREYTH